MILQPTQRRYTWSVRIWARLLWPHPSSPPSHMSLRSSIPAALPAVTALSAVIAFPCDTQMTHFLSPVWVLCSHVSQWGLPSLTAHLNLPGPTASNPASLTVSCLQCLSSAKVLVCLYIDFLSLVVTRKLPEDRWLWLVCPCRSVSSMLVLLHTERAHLIAALHSGINPAITYRINAVPIKTAVSYFTDLDKTIQEFIPRH